MEDPNPEKEIFSKREVASLQASLFDPLGFVLPFVLQARAITSEAWKAKTDWDEPLPRNINQMWKKWVSKLISLQKVKLRRCIVSTEREPIRVELHIFADASSLAYGAAAYFVSFYGGGESESVLLGSRCHVSGNHHIGRLELKAAVVASEMNATLTKDLKLSPSQSYLWTDSATTFYWLKNPDLDLKVFVSNRVKKVLSSTERAQWRWLPTDVNPADIVSRGADIDDLLEQPLWWRGPDFIQERVELWPEQPPLSRHTPLALEELRGPERPTALLAQEANPLHSLKHTTLLRVAWSAICWLRKIRRRPVAGVSAAPWRRQARDYLLQIIQKELFEEEIEAIRQGKPVARGSKLRRLDLYFDETRELIRLDGRLRHARHLEEEARSPPLVDAAHPWIKQYFQYLHKARLRHVGGRHHLLAEVARSLWVLGGALLAKRVTYHCLSCQRRRARPVPPRMAPLPDFRVNDEEARLPAFSTTAFDCAGPFQVKMGRGLPRRDRYWVLFTCTQYRAVHLEVVDSLDADSFLMAFERFMARRGAPKRLISDNGRNFVRARRELRELRQQWRAIDTGILEEKYPEIDWRFNVPLSPHSGGVFERLVRSAKDAFYGMNKGDPLYDEELRTLTATVESILNSRPLTSSGGARDAADPEVLTPSHFLSGGKPYEDLAPLARDYPYKKRWQILQLRLNDWWKRFIREVCPQLQERQKWKRERLYPEEGDVVFFLEEKHRGKWPLARVLKLYASRIDGTVRSAKLLHRGRELDRPIEKVIPIRVFEAGLTPFRDEPATDEAPTPAEEAPSPERTENH